jgi:hypothetical protein
MYICNKYKKELTIKKYSKVYNKGKPTSDLEPLTLSSAIDRVLSIKHTCKKVKNKV